MVRQCVCRQRVRQQQISRCPVRIIERPVRMIEHPYTWSLICSQVRLGTVHHNGDENRPSANGLGSSKQSPTARIDHYLRRSFKLPPLIEWPWCVRKRNGFTQGIESFLGCVHDRMNDGHVGLVLDVACHELMILAAANALRVLSLIHI